MAEIDKVFLKLDTNLRKFKQEIGIEATARAAARTPVKSGHLQNSWGFTMKATDIEIYNVADYASYIEYGTEHIAPVGMLRATLEEMPQIMEIAAERAGIK